VVRERDLERDAGADAVGGCVHREQRWPSKGAPDHSRMSSKRST
jgi:hypothetical protein